jgi:hypothetical protein
MRPVALFRLPIVIVALALLVGCKDAPEGTATAIEIATPTEPGLYPSLMVRESAAATFVDLSLAQVPNAVDLASYQGELRYDASRLSFEQATFPERVTGAAFELSPGRLRFVGTANAPTGAFPLLHLRFRAGGKVTPGTVDVAFEEVTAAADLADLTASLRNGVLLIRKHE